MLGVLAMIVTTLLPVADNRREVFRIPGQRANGTTPEVGQVSETPA